jgi:hypothetical protein
MNLCFIILFFVYLRYNHFMQHSWIRRFFCRCSQPKAVFEWKCNIRIFHSSLPPTQQGSVRVGWFRKCASTRIICMVARENFGS